MQVFDDDEKNMDLSDDLDCSLDDGEDDEKLTLDLANSQQQLCNQPTNITNQVETFGIDNLDLNEDIEPDLTDVPRRRKLKKRCRVVENYNEDSSYNDGAVGAGGNRQKRKLSDDDIKIV